MIKIKRFKKYYGNNKILDINYFHFHKDKSYLLVGKNGSGKSTLIKCILGINNITFGEIIVNANNIAYIPERYFFPEFCSIDKFLKNILYLYKKEQNIYLIEDYCERFKIDKTKKLNKLSKGMQQKVLIIQALIHDADFYIFDEPLNGLDDYSQKLFFEIIDELKQNKKSLIITTHYPALYGKNYDYYISINNGDIYNECN